jgi:hypothetical protein
MSSAPTAPPLPEPHETSTVAAVLSYLIPGLGQIYQGRFGKGFLFMVSLLGMFILGRPRKAATRGSSRRCPIVC